MVPLTSSGAKYRSGMQWADKAIRDMRPSWSRLSPRPRGGWHHDFKSAPVVLEIIKAITAAVGSRQRLTRLVDVTGAPLPTFREVEVRGRKVAVATLHPFFIERSLDTINWLLEELAKDAAVEPMERQMVRGSEQDDTALNEMATVECSNHASVRWARSKRAFFTTMGAGAHRRVAFWTVRHRARQEEASLTAEVRHQFERAAHWVISGGEALPQDPIAKKRKRPSPWPAGSCSDAPPAQDVCTSGDTDGSWSDAEDASVSPSPEHAAD